MQQKQNKHKHTFSHSCLNVQRKKDSLYISVYVKMSSSLWPLPYIFPFDGDKLYIG